jgi:hydroxypyruvate isomerase
MAMEFGLCIEMALTDLPFEDRLRKAGALGFKHVEMWLVDASYRGTPERLARLADKAGVRITNTVIGYPDGSVGGGLTDPRNRDQWLERARMTLDFCREAGIPATIVCTGNTVPGADDAAQRRSVLDGLKATLELAEAAGVTLLLEALNTRHDHPGYWLASSDSGAELCRELNSPHLRLLYDCYHMQIMEGDLAYHIEKSFDVIGHFHAAGVPGRHEVYSGEIDYAFLVDRIQNLGYAGTFALEYAPSGDHERSLRHSIEYLRGRSS